MTMIGLTGTIVQESIELYEVKLQFVSKDILKCSSINSCPFCIRQYNRELYTGQSIQEHYINII